MNIGTSSSLHLFLTWVYRLMMFPNTPNEPATTRYSGMYLSIGQLCRFFEPCDNKYKILVSESKIATDTEPDFGKKR